MANIDFAALDGFSRVAAVLYQQIVMKLADTGSLRNAPKPPPKPSYALEGFYFYRCRRSS